MIAQFETADGGGKTGPCAATAVTGTGERTNAPIDVHE